LVVFGRRAGTRETRLFESNGSELGGSGVVQRIEVVGVSFDIEVPMLGLIDVAYECECIFGRGLRQYLDSGYHGEWWRFRAICGGGSSRRLMKWRVAVAGYAI